MICSKFAPSLLEAIFLHVIERLFQCNKSSPSFDKEEKLSRHFLAKHSTSSFVCSICKLPSLTFNCFSCHKRQVHGRVGKVPIDQIDLSQFGEENPELLEEHRSGQPFWVDSMNNFCFVFFDNFSVENRFDQMKYHFSQL